MSASPELISWTRETLEGLYDLAFLRHHAHAVCVEGWFADGRSLQDALLSVVRQLKPPLNVPADSPAWRIYNTLNLRYVQGLPQSEVAARLSVGLRQARREQHRAVEAVATLLFDEPPITGLSRLAPAELEPLRPEPARDMTHLDELLSATLKVFNALLERQNTTLQVSIARGLPAVPANRMILRQLLVSALGWLIQGAAGAALSVEVGVNRGRVVMRLNKPGHQAGAGGSLEELGTLKRLAGALRAEVVVSAENERLILTIGLPASQAACVLMIDDNPHAIQLVQRYLRQDDEFYVAPVVDPREALQQVMAVRPDCILLDVMMPERDGWELLTLFKAHPATAAIPIVISSVLKEDDLARALGATAVLPKPFTAAQLIATLKSVIARSRQAPATQSQ